MPRQHYRNKPNPKRETQDATAVPQKPETEQVSQPPVPPAVKNSRPRGPRPVQIREDSFTPKNLSTVQPQFKNDPHYKNSIIVDGYSGLVRSKPLKFMNDYSQYIEIARQLYGQISKTSKSFKLNVSLAMFEYYSVVILWQRLFLVLSEREAGSTQAEEFTQKLSKILVPDELTRYLEGIGNIKDPSGRQSYLTLDGEISGATLFGIRGHYGTVDEQTHVTYETQPSPFIFAYRMCYEYCRFLSVGDQAQLWPLMWNLPPQLRPSTTLKPNANLLGWYPLHENGLSREAASLFENNVVPDLQHGTFQVVGVRSPYGVPLFLDVIEHVAQMLSTVKRGLEENNGKIITGCGGSCSQILYQDRVSDDVGEGEFGRHLRPISERILLTNSYTEVGHALACAGAIFKYRIKRHYPKNADCLCYTTATGAAPRGWDANADRVFDSQPRWNHHDFTGVRVSGCNAALDLIFKVRKIERIGD